MRAAIRRRVRLVRSPAALADFLKSPSINRNSLGMYWHAVPYLLTGVVKDQPVVAAMERAHMRHVGDMITPDDPTDVLRGFVSEDGTVTAILYLSNYGVGGYRFYSRLNDALVVSSNAFIVEMKKFGFFADFLQGAEPATLHEAVVARRKKLEKKHGSPVVFEPTLTAVAGAWEEQHSRCARGERH